MAENNGGSGFMGVIIGALLVGVLVLGFFALNGNFGNNGGAEIKVEAPEIATPEG